MRNANVVDLYRRVSIGTKVMWLRGDPHTIAGDTPVGPWPDVTIGHSANNLMTARIAAARAMPALILAQLGTRPRIRALSIDRRVID